MEDHEKNRTEYVHMLEKQIAHLTAEHDKYKAIAEQWQPKFHAVQETDVTTFNLSLGGRMVHCKVTPQYLQEVDLTSGTSTVLQALAESLVFDQFRKVITPEFDRVQRNAKATMGAGKW